MSIEIVQQRVLDYQPQTLIEQSHALKEIAQEIALMSLARANFFKIAAFQGGTCLRILYKLQRFSEDLDFVLLKPDRTFSWSKYISNMATEFKHYGYNLELQDRSKLDKNVKSAFLKADSIGGQLILKNRLTNKATIKIKLEVDSNPPAGSTYEIKYLDFPQAFGINVQDLSSLFASKIHALLCRPFVKGRDWYDFIWYVARDTIVNFELLTSAINQYGPWAGENIIVDKKWLLNQLSAKINDIDWELAKTDVIRFLKPIDVQSLDIWSKDFFTSRVEKVMLA